MQRIVKEELAAASACAAVAIAGANRQHLLEQFKQQFNMYEVMATVLSGPEPYIDLQAKHTCSLYAGICLDEVRLSPEGRQES